MFAEGGGEAGRRGRFVAQIPVGGGGAARNIGISARRMEIWVSGIIVGTKSRNKTASRPGSPRRIRRFCRHFYF